MAKIHRKQTVHESTNTLLAVPRYLDLLDDQDDEDEAEHSRLLVTSRQGWRTEMVRWISDARATELDEDFDSEDDAISAEVSNVRITKWKPVTLANLFGGCDLISSRPVSTEINAEAALMEALAEVQEDERPDDGAVEVGSDEEYNG
jgi:hypothetical protein